ncbi:MAG: hypothetical protein JKX68_07495 [Flavobacteriales bacterium]|nr:hypothetical protein [Flavobacteriales bacterium]
MNQKLLDPTAYSDDLMVEYTNVKKGLDQAMKDWEESERQLELLKS